MAKKKYKDRDDEVKAIRAENQLLLQDFEKWLKVKNLKPATIKSHISNIDFYINEYLLYYDAERADDGAVAIGSYLGDFFIRKTSWASKYTIKENIASFKKFYSFMVEKGLTRNEDLIEMKEIIKEESGCWIEEVEDYWANL